MRTDELIERGGAAFAAVADRAPVTEVRLRLADRPVLLVVVGDLVGPLTAPFAHLVDPDGTDEPELVVRAWSGPGAGLVDPGLTPDADDARYADLADDRCAMFWPEHSLVQTYRRSPGPGAPDEALWWVEDPARVGIAEVSMPLRPLIHWWSEAHGLQMVHAACVGSAEEGVLLGGVSGSGKSTTALWALTDPELRYLGDDYVLVDPAAADRPVAWSLYTTAKVHEPDRGRVPHIDPVVVGRPQQDKLVAFLHGPYGDRIVDRLPLRALLLPRVTAEGPPTITPTASAAALRRLGPSTVLQFPGADPGAVLARLAGLVRRLPSYDFALGNDPAATPAALRSFLAAAG